MKHAFVGQEIIIDFESNSKPLNLSKKQNTYIIVKVKNEKLTLPLCVNSEQLWTVLMKNHIENE